MEAITTLPVSWPFSHIGKVRDTIEIARGGIIYRVPFSTDRGSIFDFELPFGIPRKGEVLNALTIFWRLCIRDDLGGEVEDDMVAYGLEINDYLPDALKGNPHLLRRAMVSEKLDMILIETVTRDYLTGGGFRTYAGSLKERGGLSAVLCGHELPPGLCDGQKLTRPLFTPTTKAPKGEHDLDLPVQEVRAKEPLLEKCALLVSGVVSRRSARVGLIKADEKDEFGYRPQKEPIRPVLGDETGTFDCCRFWDAEDYAQSWPDKLPRSLDKEHLRDWGRSIGINNLDPKNAEHRKFVASVKTPYDVVDETSKLCLELFERIVGKPLDAFQREDMGLSEA